MHTIATTQARIFLRPGSQMPPTENWLPMLYSAGHDSYRVPVHVRQSDQSPIIDVQFGAANYPEGTQRLWDYHKRHIHAIWVRYHADDLDRIFWVTSRGKSQDRLCRYAFDHLRVTWRHGESPPDYLAKALGQGWRVHDNLWGLNTEGSYLSSNCRAAFCHMEPLLRPGIHTDTTSACLMPGGLNWRYYKLNPKSLAGFAETYDAGIEKVEFYYDRRLVRVEAMHPEEPAWGWAFFASDDWDNCADPYYQKYISYYFFSTSRRGRNQPQL